MADTRLVLNDYGLTRRTTTLKSGKQSKARYTISMQSDLLLVEVDERKMLKPLADAVADHLRMRIESISANASPRTIENREVEARALATGKQWAKRRFSGGKLGETPPVAGATRLFNNSGRLAKSIAVGPTKDGWIVNAAANRFDPQTTAGEAGLVRMMDRLSQFVPEIRNPAMLWDSIPIRRARDLVLANMIEKESERNRKLKMDLAREVIGLF